MTARLTSLRSSYGGPPEPWRRRKPPAAVDSTSVSEDPMKISRRSLLLGMASAPVFLRMQRRPARPKLAAICTTYFKYSHAQHIVDLCNVR